MRFDLPDPSNRMWFALYTSAFLGMAVSIGAGCGYTSKATTDPGCSTYNTQPSGPTGPAGPTTGVSQQPGTCSGASGATGASGASGVSGTSGASGASGASGPSGPSGPVILGTNPTWPDNPPPDMFYAAEAGTGPVSISSTSCAVTTLNTPQISTSVNLTAINAIHFASGNLFVYAGDPNVHAVDVVDTSDPGALVAVISMQNQSPSKIVASPASQYIYAFLPNVNEVMQIDSTQQHVSNPVFFTTAAYADMTVVPNSGTGDQIWLSVVHPTTEILVYNGSSGAHIATIPLAYTPGSLAYTAGNGEVYVAGSDGNLHAINTLTFSEDSLFLISGLPAGSVVVPSVFGNLLSSVASSSANRLLANFPAYGLAGSSGMQNTGESYSSPSSIVFANDERIAGNTLVIDSAGQHCAQGQSSSNSGVASPAIPVITPTSYNQAKVAVSFSSNVTNPQLQLDSPLASQAQTYPSGVNLYGGSQHLLMAPSQTGPGGATCTLNPQFFTVPPSPTYTVSVNFSCN